MGVLDLRKVDSQYEKLEIIYNKVLTLCDLHHPDYMAVESPFYGKNAQVLFKLGRAQGAAMVAAQSRGVEITEYAPRKAKMTICGNGSASKQQVALMVKRTLGIDVPAAYLDATDALALAMCHYYQLSSPLAQTSSGVSSWEKFIAQNPDRVK